MTNSYSYDAKGQMEDSAEIITNPAYPHTKYVWYVYDQNGNRNSMEVMLSKSGSDEKGASKTLSQIVNDIIAEDPTYNSPDLNDKVVQSLEFLLTGKKMTSEVSDDLISLVVDTVDQAPFIYEYTNDVSKDWITGLYSPVTNATYSYHYNTTTGNMESYEDYYGSCAYQWDNKNRLLQHSTPSSIIEYVYDANDRRITKTVKPNPANGQEATVYSYKYDGLAVMEELIEEKDSNGQTTDSKLIQYTYEDHDTPLAIKLGNNTFYYVKDGHGDIREITDSNGDTVVKYSYDAWGGIMDTTATASQAVTLQEAKEIAEINPYRYAAYRYDNESNMYYLRARYYQPTIGRFISKDPIVHHNNYIYAGNTPVNAVDTTGMRLENLVYNDSKKNLVWILQDSIRHLYFQSGYAKKFGELKLDRDGVFGPKTNAAMITFNRTWLGRKNNGGVDSKTWHKLLRVTATGNPFNDKPSSLCRDHNGTTSLAKIASGFKSVTGKFIYFYVKQIELANRPTGVNSDCWYSQTWGTRVISEHYGRTLAGSLSTCFYEYSVFSPFGKRYCSSGSLSDSNKPGICSEYLPMGNIIGWREGRTSSAPHGNWWPPTVKDPNIPTLWALGRI